jgi:hypothetical protein
MGKETGKAGQIAEIIRKALEEHPEIGETIPQPMLDPFTMQPTIAIMVETDKGLRLGYRINIHDIAEINLKEDE